MSSSKSLIGHQLTQALACCIVNRSSHLAAISIVAGVDNPMADLASRSFKKTGVHGNYALTDSAFLTRFNSDFALPQDNSWLMLRLLTCLLCAVRADSTNGVLAQTQKVRLQYWTHWAHFAQQFHMDPFLRGVNTPSRVALLSAFAHHVSEGKTGQGHQVRSGSVQDALCAIGKTFELDLQPNPTYQVGAYGQYWAPLRDMLRGYRRHDPKSSPQLAVPVSITEHLLNQHWAHPQHCPQREATADLTNVAFYYLLRVGEYTKPRATATNTIPIRIKDITFRTPTGALIANNSPLATLLAATEATIQMPNQKNGVKG
jgi:hypothetical protein